MKRVVVTGASGFIGAYLIQELLKDTEKEIYSQKRQIVTGCLRMTE